MMPENQDLIWVDKDFAERYKEILSDASKREEQEKIFDGYFNKLTAKIQEEFRVQLEGLEEDAAMFTGLMLKVKQTFNKAADEHLNASYELWENYDKELPNVERKIKAMIDKLEPLVKLTEKVNDLLNKINTFNIDKLNESLTLLSSTYGKNREMLEFLVNNFRQAGDDKCQQ
jgi:hypothetical protein